VQYVNIVLAHVINFEWI